MLFELLVMVVEEPSETLQAIVITPGCLPEVKGKSLLMKEPGILTQGREAEMT